MTLSELLESRFRGDVRFRGVAYMKAERVAITRVTTEHVFGVVRDGTEFQTQLSREDGELKMHCNCARGTQPPACKHLWATVLAVDESGLLTGSAKPGYIPPFAAEVPSFDIDDDDWDDLSSGEVFRPSRTTTAPTQPTRKQVKTREATTVLREWEGRLQEVRSEMAANEPAVPTAGREREIFYEIDIDQSREIGQLVIQTSQRQRRANGQWGKLKPLKLRPGRLDEIEHRDDSQILAYLSGGTPERTNWHAQQSEIQTSVFRYRVPYDLCELIMPLMCRTGRVRYLNTSQRESEPLEWDEADPWELTMEVVFDDDANSWKLRGQLRRGDETQSLQETELLVPGGLVLTAERIARLRDFDAFEWVKLLSSDEPITAEKDEGHELVDRLLDMPTLPRLELPEELRLEEVRAEPSPHLTVRSPRSKRWHLERLHGEVEFDYLGTRIPGGSEQWAIVQRDQGRCLIRNTPEEERAWNQLQEHGFRRLLDQRRTGYDVEIAARDLGASVRELIKLGWQVHADGHRVRQPAELRFRIQSQTDWFELHADIDFEGRTVSFPELLSALSRGDSTVRLDDGSLGILPEEWAQQYGLLAGLGTAEEDEDHVRFTANQIALLDALLQSRGPVEIDERFAELRERFRSFSGVEEQEEPEGFEGELRGYQREGLGWLRFLNEFHLGGCLADDMGLGKTVQVLALLLDRWQKTPPEERLPSLVVVPKSLMFNWHQESTRFAPQLRVLDYTGIDRAPLRDQFSEHDLILTTYGTLRRDVFTLKDEQFDYIVLDEAQTIKNAGAQVAKASRLLQGKRRLALSGTPIENHLGDLWSIFEFLNPGMLGRSSIFKLFVNDTENAETRSLLAQGLRPFILRRTKAEVANELPEKFEQTIYCDMGKEQRRLYEELRDHYRDSLLGLVRDQGINRSKMHVLEALLRLRQAACHPALLDRGDESHSSAKLDVLAPHLIELIDEGHKALVFSQFTSMLSIVRKQFDSMGIRYAYLDGQTRDREKVVEEFQNDPKCGAFLISLKAGGLGLNLTAADYVFLLDPWWNPAVEAQAIDRAHRVGQTRQVFAYRLICRDTVEEKICELQGKKRQLADAILEADQRLMRDLSTEDLEMLLS